jgi:tetratricopeptide (TPR) repeat protein
MRSHRTHGWLILESGSVSYGKATPYLSVIELLKAYFKIQDRDGQREIRERVAGKLLMLDRALEPLLPPLLALLDVPVDDAAWAALDPPHRRLRTLEAIKRMLLRESQVQPLLVLFEDLHWIDSETQAVLDSLIESLPTSRILLLVNYRPEYEHAWGRKTFYSQLRIDPLPPESAEELLSVLLGEDGTLEPLKRVLIARTEGNPFFLEESVRTLVETGALAGERGAYRAARPLPAIHVPATVQAVLAARIDRLPPGDKAMLQMASVVGKDIPVVLLQAIAEPTEDELRAALGRLQAAEFLYETSLFPDPEYTFKHALTHEVAYDSLLQERRRALHAQIAEAIEQLYRDRLAEHVERLAHHALRGELWEKAATYLRQAGAKALTRSANREAAAYFEQALTALTHLPETHETRERAIDVRFDLHHAFAPLAEFSRIEAYLREAEALAMALDDQRRLGWVSAYTGAIYMMASGHVTDMRTAIERVEAIGETLGDKALQVAAQHYRVHVDYLAGDYRGTEDTCRRLMLFLQGDDIRDRFGPTQSPAVLSRAFLARALAERGVFDEGEAHGQEAVSIAEALDHPFSLVEACVGLAYVHSVGGDLNGAIRPAERAVALCRDWTLTTFAPNAMATLGRVYAGLGRVEEGLPWLQQALAGHDSAGIGYFYAVSLVQVGEAYRLAGHVEDARACANRALALTRERGERGHEAWALRLLGEIAAHADPPDLDSAQQHYSQALTRGNELGMRPLAAHCHLGLGKLFHRNGDQAKAAEHLTIAAAMYREMDMGFWLEKAEVELVSPQRSSL